MKIGMHFTIDEYSGPHTEFVDLYNKWQIATAFLSTGNCEGKKWDELIAYGKEHQDEVKEVIKEFLLVDGNEGNWMAMSVLEACCPEVNENIKVEGYIHPEDFHKLLMKVWDYIF